MALYLGSLPIDAYGGQPIFSSATLVTLNVVPNISSQTLVPSGSVDGWNRVEVAAIPSDYIIPSGTFSIISNGVYNVRSFVSASINVEPVLQSKSITPTETEQSVIADNGYDGLSLVQVASISSTYVGTGIARKSTDDLIISGSTVTTLSGYYSSDVSKSISQGIATTPATTITVEPSLSINSTTGVVTTSFSSSSSITPTIVSGYISSGTSGIISVNGSGVLSLATQSASTITPTTSQQVAVEAGKYTLGSVVVSSVPTESKTITENGDYFPTQGLFLSKVTVSINTVNNQSKDISPTESEQELVADEGYTGLDVVTVHAISSNYVGSNIPRKSTSDLIVSESTVTIPSGYYSSQVSSSVNSGTATTPATNITVNPTIVLNSTNGTITASYSGNSYITPTVVAGYISNGISGVVSIGGTSTFSLTTQSAITVVPTESVQTAVGSGVYTVGSVIVNAISSTYVGSGIPKNPTPTVSGSIVTIPTGYYSQQTTASVASGTAGVPTVTKGTVVNNEISVTPTVTNTEGYIIGSTLTGTSVTISASELVSGNLSITSNNTYDVINYESVTVNIPTGIDGDNLGYGDSSAPYVNVAQLDFVIEEGDESSSQVGTGQAGFSIVGE